MNSDKNDIFSRELDNCIDELFGEEKKKNNEVESDNLLKEKQDENSSINSLKAIIFSIDWEINDEIMEKFNIKIKELKTEHKNNSSLSKLLDMLNSIGRYIKIKKAKAHPDSIKLLHLFYNNFENTVLSNDITKENKDKLLLDAVEKYTQFEEQTACLDELKDFEDELKLPDIFSMGIKETCIKAFEEFKKNIEPEFKTLIAKLTAGGREIDPQ
ncbi:hypothetical protein GMMP1_80014 [Candidatus Magnetomoraceae bacterium gMMP-1]